MENKDIYDEFDLLLPSKFEGGYLIILLYQKIASNHLKEWFTNHDIKAALEEISANYDQGDFQSERIVKKLLHYFLKNAPNEYGKYRLTDHAVRMVELMLHKLDNPYKNYPLKQTFEKYFVLKSTDTKTITDLELKFGSEFVAPHKRIINDHLESLEDELNDAYNDLNLILRSEDLDATLMVTQFVEIFKKFGIRSEDIMNAISSKDKFLRHLRNCADEYYRKIQNHKHPDNEDERACLENLQLEWRKASAIFKDIDSFFQTVDSKISNIRRQILSASGKLYELHENFSAHSNLRLLTKKLLALTLNNASFSKEGAVLSLNFPLKEVVHEKTQLFHIDHYDFDIARDNAVIDIPRDEEYEKEQKAQIEKDVQRQETINAWTEKALQSLSDNGELDINGFLSEIIEEACDYSIAIDVSIGLTEHVSSAPALNLSILPQAERLKDLNIYIWKMRIKSGQTMLS